MAHLNVRVSEADLHNLTVLQQYWGTDRSETARKALALAAETTQHHKPLPKEELLKSSQIVGAITDEDSPRVGYKNRLKEKMQKKHGRS